MHCDEHESKLLSNENDLIYGPGTAREGDEGTGMMLNNVERDLFSRGPKVACNDGGLSLNKLLHVIGDKCQYKGFIKLSVKVPL